MGDLGHVDLNRLAGDTGSFLARVLQVGRSQGFLPEGFGAALAAFLRTHALAHARRHRTGLAIDRQALEPGVRQGFACIEAAVEHAAAGDLRGALEQLLNGDLEALRQQGWERIWTALDEMRAESCDLLRSPVAALLEDWRPALQLWAGLVPETWSTTDAHGDPVRVEPSSEYARFRPVARRGWFVRSLPYGGLKPLLAAWPARAGYPAFLRQLVVALAVDRLSLPVRDADVAAFTRTCFAGGVLRPEVRERVHTGVAEQVAGAVPGTRRDPLLPCPDRDPVTPEILETLAALEQASPQTRRRLVAL